MTRIFFWSVASLRNAPKHIMSKQKRRRKYPFLNSHVFVVELSGKTRKVTRSIITKLFSFSFLNTQFTSKFGSRSLFDPVSKYRFHLSLFPAKDRPVKNSATFTHCLKKRKPEVPFLVSSSYFITFSKSHIWVTHKKQVSGCPLKRERREKNTGRKERKTL